MAKVARAVRLRPETVERVKALAKSLERSEQAVLEQAVESFLDLAEGGTPDVPEEPPTPRPVSLPPVADHDAIMRDRQRRLAKEMGWAS